MALSIVMSIEATGPRPVSLIKSFDPKFNSLLKCGKSRGSNRESERASNNWSHAEDDAIIASGVNQ